MKIELDELFSYGIDLKNRRIYFGAILDTANENIGDVTQSSIELAIRALHKLSSDAPGRPIEIHMNSYGGSPYDMLRLYDEILTCPCQVKFYGGGAIMSAATWIMAACDERYLYPNATVMVHDGWAGSEGKHTDMQIWVAEEKRLQSLLYDIYSANSRMPKDFWQDVCQRDLYLSANEAIMLGLADKLVESKKRGNLRKMRHSSMKKTPDAVQMKELLKGIYSRINKVKIPKIELNQIVKDPSDPHLVVDDKPAENDKTAKDTEETKTN